MTPEKLLSRAEEYAEKNKPSDALCSMGEIIGNAREYDGLKQGFIDGAFYGEIEGEKETGEKLLKKIEELRISACINTNETLCKIINNNGIFIHIDEIERIIKKIIGGLNDTGAIF